MFSCILFSFSLCVLISGNPQNVLTDAFGVVAMVAMTPLITIQTLGFKAIMSAKVRNKIAMKRILSADDEQVCSRFCLWRHFDLYIFLDFSKFFF